LGADRGRDHDQPNDFLGKIGRRLCDYSAAVGIADQDRKSVSGKTINYLSNDHGLIQ